MLSKRCKLTSWGDKPYDVVVSEELLPFLLVNEGILCDSCEAAFEILVRNHCAKGREMKILYTSYFARRRLYYCDILKFFLNQEIRL